MAKEKVKQEPKEVEAVEGETPKKKRGGLRKLIVLLLILAGGGGGAAWYFLQPAKGQHAAAEKPKAKPPVFERLEAFTVNLAGEGEHYLQVEISLKISDPKIGEDVKLYMPEIRDRVLRLLSSKHAEELSTPEGKTKLSEEIRAQVNKPLNPPSPSEGVLGVFFTSFVIQ